MECIYCNNSILYKLKSGQFKCSVCKKKFSPKKLHTDLELIKYFCNNHTANHSAIKLNLNYITVKKRYELFRIIISNYLEVQYTGKTIIEYDEYVYLEKSKKKIKKNVFDAQNFLTLHYDDKVYNLLMPNLKMYKKQFMYDGVQEVYFKEFSKFMILNKISKTKKRENIITRFWLYLEESILKYKGISDENFIYYLKEIEFKFNYPKEMQENIIKTLYFGKLV